MAVKRITTRTIAATRRGLSWLKASLINHPRDPNLFPKERGETIRKYWAEDHADKVAISATIQAALSAPVKEAT